MAVFFIDDIAFSAAQLLRDDLASFLSSDATKIFRRHLDIDELAYFAVWI